MISLQKDPKDAIPPREFKEEYWLSRKSQTFSSSLK